MKGARLKKIQMEPVVEPIAELLAGYALIAALVLWVLFT